MAANIGAIVALIGDKNEAAAQLLDKQEFTANQLQSMKPKPLQDVLIQHGKMSAGAAMRAVEHVHLAALPHLPATTAPKNAKPATAAAPTHRDKTQTR